VRIGENWIEENVVTFIKSGKIFGFFRKGQLAALKKF